MRCIRVMGSAVMGRLRFRRCFPVVMSAMIFIAVIDCAPTRRIRRAVSFDDNLISKLTDYGYLPMSDYEAGNLRTDDELRDAIKEFQKFGNIPETGELDDETQQLLQSPRCGVPDGQSTHRGHGRNKRYVLHAGPKWPTTTITWSLRTKKIYNLDTGRVRHALYKAFEVWARNSKLTFTEVDSDTADILVYFARGYHDDARKFDGRGHVLAHAYFPGPGLGGDAHFDEDEEWQLDINDGQKGTNLFAVAAHEFGHSLGLEHSSVNGSLMYPWYQGLKANYELPRDDREAIQILYGGDDATRRYPPYMPERPHDRPTTHPPYQPPRYPSPDLPRQHPPHEPPKYYPPYQHPPAPSPPKPPVQPPYHRPSRPPPAPSPPKPPVQPPYHRPSSPEPIPNTCDTSYDAISIIRGELFIFKDKYLWRINDKKRYEGYPVLIERVWSGLLQNYTHVDAVYERHDHKIMFFVGRQVYLFNGHVLQNDYPKPLTSLGLPDSLNHIDAVMIWGYNHKTYLFSGSAYWKLDDETGRVELDYPRDIMRVWQGVGYNIDAAFQWKDGATYFFKGKGFWKLDDTKLRVTNAQQNLSAPVWMRCSEELANPYTKLVTADSDSVDIYDISKKDAFSISLFSVIAAAVVIISIVIAVVTMLVKGRKTHCYTRPKTFGR